MDALLPEGSHDVIVKDFTRGCNSGILSFVTVRFENPKGYFENRFDNTGEGRNQMTTFFYSTNVYAAQDLSDENLIINAFMLSLDSRISIDIHRNPFDEKRMIASGFKNIEPNSLSLNRWLKLTKNITLQEMLGFGVNVPYPPLPPH